MDVMNASGVDTKTFKSHSLRSASTSKSEIKGLCLKDIGKAAGWSRTSTYRTFYKKPIVSTINTVLLPNE